MANITSATAPIVAVFESASSIRIIMIDNEPWFVAADVCSALNLQNPSVVCSKLDEDERSKFNLGRQGVVTIINESGLGCIILRCDDAIKQGTVAHKFRKWVTGEVLPSIRKTGSYSVKQEDPVATDGEPLTQEQLIYLKSKVSKVSHMFLTITRQKVTSMIYRRIKSTFRISRIDDLPQCGLAYAEMMLRMIEAESRRHWSNTAPVERKILSGLNLLEMEG